MQNHGLTACIRIAVLVSAAAGIMSCSTVKQPAAAFKKSEAGLRELLSSGRMYQPQGMASNLVFFLDFDHDGIAYKGGAFALTMELDKEQLVPGYFGQGYRFESGVRNLLSSNQSSAEEGTNGFQAEGGAVVATGKRRAWQGKRFLRATLPDSKAIIIVPVEKPVTRYFISGYIASLYVRGAAGSKIGLFMTSTNLASTNVHEQEVVLSNVWRRVSCFLPVAGKEKKTISIALKIRNLGNEPVQVDMDGLQIEKVGRNDAGRTEPARWVAGGQSRGMNSFRVALHKIPFFSSRTGTIALWTKTLPAETGGSWGRHCLTGVGSSWWKPEWAISTRSFTAGFSASKGYKESIIHNGNRIAGALADGQWHHLALTWDEKELAGFLDGKEIGRKPIVATKELDGLALMIGRTPTPPNPPVSAKAVLDEIAVYAHCFTPDEIRSLKDLKAPPGKSLPQALLEGPSRTVFTRNETDAEMSFKPVYRGRSKGGMKVVGTMPADKACLQFSSGLYRLRFKPCRLLPGNYPITIAVDDGRQVFPGRFDIKVFPAPANTNFIMCAWWDYAGDAESLGFNACIGSSSRDVIASAGKGLFIDIRIGTDRRCYHPMDPDVLNRSRAKVSRIARDAGHYPQVVACLINSEISCRKVPADKPWFVKWLKKETGLDAGDLRLKGDPRYSYKPHSVKNGVVPDDDPAYRFYRWWMARGYGWGEHDAEMRKAMENEGLNTMYSTDRVHSPEAIKKMELVSDWKYPETAEGLVVTWSWLRSRAILVNRGLFPASGNVYWDDGSATRVKVDDKKPVLCYSPDVLRETLWITLAEPVWGIMFYGLSHRKKDYYDKRCDDVMREFLAVAPAIGSMLKDVPRRQNDVAMLETSSLAAMDAEIYKWFGYWNMRFFSRALARARVDYDWITEEHVRAGWLKKYKYVIVPYGRYLPENIHKALCEFAESGGQVIADEMLVADIPGVKKLPYRFLKKGWTGGPMWKQGVKAAMDWGAEYRASQSFDVTVSNPLETWLVERTLDDVRYLFVINDKFVPGEIAERFKVKFNVGGERQLIRDQGLAQEVEVTARAPSAAVIYDVLKHEKVRMSRTNGTVKWKAQLPAGGARVYAVYPEEISDIRIVSPKEVVLGNCAQINISIRLKSGKPAYARQLLEVEVTDPAGEKLDINRFWPIKNGNGIITFWVPRNANTGEWQMSLKEWTTGKSFSRTIIARP